LKSGTQYTVVSHVQGFEAVSKKEIKNVGETLTMMNILSPPGERRF